MKNFHSLKQLAMWAVLALGAAGCDPEEESLSPVATGLSRDAGAALPSCESRVAQGKVVYESEEGAWVAEAQSSVDGYTVVLIERVVRPASLLLVQSPGGGEEFDLTPLMPAGAALRSMSEVRDGKVFVVYVVGAEVGLSQIDLGRRAVAWSVPAVSPQDVSAAAYDAKGNIIVASGPATPHKLVTGRGSLRVASLGGDRYAILGTLSNGTWLLSGDREGRNAKAINVLPNVTESFRLAAKPGELAVDDRGDLHVLTDLNGDDRAAFEKIHQVKLKNPKFLSLPVVLSFSAASQRSVVHEPSLRFCRGPIRALSGTLDAHEGRLAWSGGCNGQPWVTFGDARSPGGKTTEVSLGPDTSVRSALIADAKALYVTGDRLKDPRAAPDAGTGQAVIARIGHNGQPVAACLQDAAQGEGNRLIRSGVPMITEERLVAIQDPDTRVAHTGTGSTVIRLLPPHFLERGE